MNVRQLVLIALVSSACGCTTIKKIATPATQVDLVSSKSQDTPEYWQQEWKLHSTNPVAIKLWCVGKSFVLTPNSTQGEGSYTVTMRLGKGVQYVQGLIAVAETSATKGAGKTISGSFVLKDFPKGSLRGGTHPATTMVPGKVPLTFEILKLGTDSQASATLTLVERNQTAQFRNESR